MSNKISYKIADLSVLSTDKFEFGMALYDRGYPIWKEYLSKTGITKINTLEEWFGGNKKHVMKFVNMLLSYNGIMGDTFGELNRGQADFANPITPPTRLDGPGRGLVRANPPPVGTPTIGTSEYHFTIKTFAHLIQLLGYDRLTKLLRMILDKKVDLHEWVANLPKIKLNDSPEEVFLLLKGFLRFKKELRYEVMNFMNYKKVRTAKNAEEAMKHIRVVKMARNKLSKADIVQANMSLCDLFNGDTGEFDYVDQSKVIQFTKDPVIVASIGQETHCCFKKGGLAGSLLEPAMKSPIGGILHGYRPSRWFSLVWEMVVEEESVFKKLLILDNIESSGRLPEQFFHSIVENLRETSYAKIHLGSMRNDISIPIEVTQGRMEADPEGYGDDAEMTPSVIKKPIHMVGYEKNWAKYNSFDDSKNLYTIHKKKNDTEVISHPMNMGDLHRCKYVEQWIYDDPDDDFIKINVKASPSYIWESSTAIYGYFTTRLKWYHDTWTRYEQYEDLKVSEFKKIVKENKENELPPTTGMVKVLYLEDIFMLPYRCLKLSLDDVFNHLIEWCKKHHITKISGSMNEEAKNFQRRIEAAGFEYYAQENTPTFKAGVPDRHESLSPTSISFLDLDFEEPEEKVEEKEET